MREQGFGMDKIAVGASVGINEHAKWQPKWKIEKYDKDMNLYETEEFDGNLLLNEGIAEMLALLIGGTATAFNNANAHIGVGDGTTAAVATQTGLVGTNKTYAPMDATYPQVSDNTVVFRATFDPDVGNFRWEELAIANGNSDSSKNLNRKVQFCGEKAAPHTWVVECSISIT